MRLLIPVFLFIAAVFVFSCTKIDSTALGSDLIPAVDNINTFDTVIDVLTTNFLQSDDSTRLSYSDPLAVGHINDPLFGTSDAALYFEMKPIFPATPLRASDTLQGFDSAVLCLRYTGGYGDTMQTVKFRVFTLNTQFKDTALYTIKDAPPLYNFQEVGFKEVSLNSLNKDSVTINRSSAFRYKTIRELRIPLNSNVVNWFDLLKDSSRLSRDSLFRLTLKGFRVEAQVMSAIGSMAYFNISDTASKLEFFYRKKNVTIDTTRTTYYFNPNNSGYANNINWNRTGSEVAGHLNPTNPASADSLLYVKTTPGTAVRIRIPGLENVTNRIIHRAEIKMYQMVDNVNRDGLLLAPPLLYLERFTPGNLAYNTYKSIPFDLSPSTAYGDCYPTTTGIDYSYFGGFPKDELVSGVTGAVKTYTFNISRYVQQIVLKKLPNADLRLTSNLFTRYEDCANSLVPIRITNNPISYGRVRLGGGLTPNPNRPLKMKLRIIYSKL